MSNAPLIVRDARKLRGQKRAAHLPLWWQIKKRRVRRRGHVPLVTVLYVRQMLPVRRRETVMMSWRRVIIRDIANA